jgi:hypothetical protein
MAGALIYRMWPRVQAWWKGWGQPGKPVDTFFDDSPAKAESVKSAPASSLVRGEAQSQDERLFWLEQEFGKFRSQIDQFHPLQARQNELTGEQAANKHRLNTVEATLNKMDRQFESLCAELSSVINSTKSFEGTLGHLLRTKVSVENYAPLRQTVGRQQEDLTVIKGQLKKLVQDLPIDGVVRLSELVNELRRDHTGTRTIVNGLQGNLFDQTLLNKRIQILEQAQTDRAKLFDAAKQSADIKAVAAFEGREAAKTAVETAKTEMSEVILKKFVTEVQEVFDHRYEKAKKAAPKRKVAKAKVKPDAAGSEKKSVEAFINKAKRQNRSKGTLMVGGKTIAQVQSVKILG